MIRSSKDGYTRPVGIRQLLGVGAVIIDVRTNFEYSSGHIKGSKNIPLDTIRSRVEEIKAWGKPVIVVCHSGTRSGTAAAYLHSMGVQAVNGGSWKALNNII